MKKTLTISGKTFTVANKPTENVNALAYYSGRTIYDCYSRPSVYKVSIYNEWLQWASDNNVYHFGVRSYNTNIFTLQGYIEIDGKGYVIIITPTYNTLIPVA